MDVILWLIMGTCFLLPSRAYAPPNSQLQDTVFQVPFGRAASCRTRAATIEQYALITRAAAPDRFTSSLRMTKRDDDNDNTAFEDQPSSSSTEELDPRRPDKNLGAFFDAMLGELCIRSFVLPLVICIIVKQSSLDRNSDMPMSHCFTEIPDSRLLAGDLLFLLIVNYLLQIADEVGDPSFWMNGGFSQSVTMPTTLLALIVRDSKMSISWVLGAIWNRAYSTSSVADDETSVKRTLDVWVNYFSMRILLELGGSALVTHTPVDGWMLAREVWYTAIVMVFFRVAYGRFRSNIF